MRPNLTLHSFILLFIFLSTTSFAQQAKNSGNNYEPGEIIVKFKSNPQVLNTLNGMRKNAKGINLQSSSSQTESMGIQSIDKLNKKFKVREMKPIIKKPISPQNLKTIRKPIDYSALPDLSTLVKIVFDTSSININQVLRAYASDENVSYAEPNYRYYYNDKIPNDARFGEQWALHNTGQTGGTPDADIDAPEAWEIQTGDPNVIVGILDTGVDLDHPDLAANIWINEDEIPGNGIDDDENGYVDDVHGYDFFNEDGDPQDDHYHGTHCAGIVGAVSDNGDGVTGVAPNVRIMALKIGPPERPILDAGIEAIYYAANNGAQITSNSWGGNSYSQALEEAFNYADQVGLVSIGAAGNNDSKQDFYPAMYEFVLAVASTDHNDVKSDFSNYGDWIDVSAPGSEILNTKFDDSYYSLSGTSMAAPHVAGLAALLFSEHPDWTPSQVRLRIKNTADDINDSNAEHFGLLGSGRINAHKALMPAEPSLKFADVNIDDDLYGASVGNQDGIANAGETIELLVSLRNVGAEISESAEVRLRSTGPHVSILDSIVSIGQISSISGPVEADNVFLIKISEYTPTGSEIPLSLHITDAGGLSWDIEFTINVYSRYKISGQITDLATGAGIPNAKVFYKTNLPDFVLCDENGFYEITDIVNGTYQITAHHSDYEESDPVIVTVPPEQNEVNIGLGTAIFSIFPQNLDFNLDWNTNVSLSGSIQNDGWADMGYNIIEFQNENSQTPFFNQEADYRDALVKSLRDQKFEAVPIADGIEIAVSPKTIPDKAIKKAVEQWRAVNAENPIKTIKAVTLKAVHRNWCNQLNTQWYDYGPVPIFVDTKAVDWIITYEDLVQSNADVLIVTNAYPTCPYYVNFTKEEQEAIQKYLNHGKGLIVTAGTLNGKTTCDHVPFFAELLGLDPNAAYDWPIEELPSFMEKKQSSLLRNVDLAYLPSTGTFCNPVNGNWNDVIKDAEIIAATPELDAVLTVKERYVYISNMPELESNRNDLQLLYNAVLHAGTDIPWLSSDYYHGDISPHQQQAIEFTASSKNLLPSGEYEAELLVLSNDKDNPMVRVPVSAKVGDAARMEVVSLSFDDDLSGESNGNQDGLPAAGERIELGLSVMNNGNVDANDLSVQVSSSSQYLTFIQNSAQLGNIAANAQEEYTAVVLFDISAATPDEEFVWLYFDFVDASNAQWQDSVKIELTRYAAISGSVTSANTGQPVENGTVTYYGPLSGNTTTNASGEYNLSLREGEYRMWAEGEGFCQSDGILVTLPYYAGPLDFQLTKPVLNQNPEPISLELGSNTTHTITLANSGDEALHYFPLKAEFESKVSGLTDRVSKGEPPVESRMVPGDMSYGVVALFMDTRPWGQSVNEDILSFHNIPYEILNSDAMGIIDLSQYTKVVIPSVQNEKFYTEFWDNNEWFEAYVEAGGVLELHTATRRPGDAANKEYPGGLYFQEEDINDLDIQCSFHPIVNVPSPIEADDLDKWYTSAFGYFSTVPENALPIAVHAEKGYPTTVQVQLGKGQIIATQQLVEWIRADMRFLENMLLFGLQKSTWMTVSPTAGSIQPGEESQIDVNLSIDDLTPGETKEGNFKIYSNLPGSKIIDVPVQLKRTDTSIFTIVSLQIQDAAGGDNDEIPESGESVILNLSFKNGGNITASNITCLLSTTTPGVTIQNATLPLGAVEAGQVSAEIAYNIDLGAELTDKTELQFTVELSGDNGFSQTLTTDVITVMSDDVPPDPVTNLQMLAATSNALFVAFDVTGDNGSSGQAAAYDLRYSETPITAENFSQASQMNVSTQPKASGARDTLMVSGLETGKMYYVALVILDDAGNSSALSNVVSEQTGRLFEHTIHSYEELIGNKNNTVNPGEKIKATFIVQNVSQSALNGVYIVADTSFDDYFYKNSWFYKTSWIKNTLGTMQSKEKKYAMLTFYVSSNTPDGHILQIPLIFYDGNNTIIDRDILSIPIHGSDTCPPFISYGTSNMKFVWNQDLAVGLGVWCKEPGEITSVEAVIEDDMGNEVDRVAMALYEQGFITKDAQNYRANWTVPKESKFYLRVHAVDGIGNAVLSDTLLGFTSERFYKQSKVLIVYENADDLQANDHLKYITDSFERLGIQYDLINTYFNGFVFYKETLKEYLDGAVFWFTPGNISDVYGLTGQTQMNNLVQYMDNGGSLFLASQYFARGISYGTYPEFLSQYLGSELTAYRINLFKLDGIEGDYLGDGLELSIKGEGGANNQWGQCAIAPVPGAVPFLRWDPNSIMANGPANQPGFAQSSEQYGGVWYAPEDYRSIFLSFGFEAINSATMRDNLLKRSHNWLMSIGEDIPPANVTDLASGASSPAYVEIKWTAPGEDGNIGKATIYDIRYSNTPPGNQAETWWQTAQQVEDEPEPLPAGSKQFYRFYNATENQNYYFMLKTSDQLLNQSGLSNVAFTAITDNYPPEIVTFSPTRDTTITEGSSIDFFVEITDEDDETFFCDWLYNDFVISTDTTTNKSSFTLQFPMGATGTHSVKALVTDGKIVVETIWNVTVKENSVPEIVTFSPKSDTTIAEGNSIDFSIEVKDVDNDMLVCTWFYDGNVISTGTTVNKSSINVEFPVGSAGTHSVKASVTDGKTTVEKMWNITVTANSTPQIVAFSPNKSTTIIEGDSIEFFIEATDEDNDTFFCTWFHNNTEISKDTTTKKSSLTLLFPLGALGMHTVKVSVTDGKNIVEKKWVVTVKNNSAPEIVSFSPATDTTVTEEDSIEFFIEAKDENNDMLFCSWVYDDSVMSIDTTMNKSSLKLQFPIGTAGTHTVKASVTDSKNIVERKWNVTVTENFSPEIVTFSPTTDTTVTEGDSIEFFIEAKDENNDTLYCTWVYDDSVMAIDTTMYKSSFTLQFPIGTTGTHSVKASVTDGINIVETKWNVTVEDYITAVELKKMKIPTEYMLEQNYPNPFNSSTTICYQLPKPGRVNISIYNVAGQLIKTLVNENKNAGYFSVNWQASGVGTGLYYYRIDAGDFSAVKKVMVMK